jgi:hypothetical protein
VEVLLEWVGRLVGPVLAAIVSALITNWWKNRKMRNVINAFNIVGIEKAVEEMDEVLQTNVGLGRQIHGLQEAVKRTRQAVAKTQTHTLLDPYEIMKYQALGINTTRKSEMAGLEHVYPALEELEVAVDTNLDNSIVALSSKLTGQVSAARSRLETSHKTLMGTLERFKLA